MNFLNFLVVTWVFSPFVFVASKHKVKTSKKRKKKKDYGGGDVDYNDPLQRWQKKYGTWEPRSR